MLQDAARHRRRPHRLPHGYPHASHTHTHASITYSTLPPHNNRHNRPHTARQTMHLPLTRGSPSGTPWRIESCRGLGGSQSLQYGDPSPPSLQERRRETERGREKEGRREAERSRERQREAEKERRREDKLKCSVSRISVSIVSKHRGKIVRSLVCNEFGFSPAPMDGFSPMMA